MEHLDQPQTKPKSTFNKVVDGVLKGAKIGAGVWLATSIVKRDWMGAFNAVTALVVLRD